MIGCEFIDDDVAFQFGVGVNHSHCKDRWSAVKEPLWRQRRGSQREYTSSALQTYAIVRDQLGASEESQDVSGGVGVGENETRVHASKLPTRRPVVAGRSAVSAEAQAQASVDNLLDVLDLDESRGRTTEDIFTGQSQSMPTGRIYGGQVLGQSIMAAERTMPEDRAVHSMHGYFLRPGDSTQGLTIAVDRIHDGRSFSTRRSQAYQNGVPIFSMIASFQDEAPGLEHAEAMPEGVPQPEDIEPDEQRVVGPASAAMRLLTDRPVDIRHIETPLYVASDDERSARQAVWMRMRAPMPDDPRLHRAALAYLSDMTIQESILRAHRVTWSTDGLKVASLDHAMWWHRPARVDEWLLYVQESPNARGGRGLATGRIYTRDGVLAASVAQEIMVRVPAG